MKLKNFLYLTQLEGYDIPRIKNWLKNNPSREVKEIKHQLVWTTKIKFLYIFASILFFLPPPVSVFLGIYLLTPFDLLIKYVIVLLAIIKLKFFHPRLQIIAITGSWGKTTVKEALTTIISTKYSTQSTTGNQNTLLGVCQKILRLPTTTQYFIAEIGAYYPGDIAKVCDVLHPKIGIITAIGPMHLERFGSLENVTKTKMELAQSLPADGHLFLPASIQPSVMSLPLKVKNINYFKNVTDVYSHLAKILSIASSNIKLPTPEHRRQIMKNGSMTIIDDTYNSNPAGFELALTELKDIKSPNKILVTPGMIELGDLQASENTRLAKIAGRICQHVIVVGQTNREALLSGLKDTPTTVHTVDQLSDAQTLLPSITIANTAVLLENDLGDQYF